MIARQDEQRQGHRPTIRSVAGSSPLGAYPAYRRDPLDFHAGLARRFGDIVAYRMLGAPVVFLNAPELIGSLLVEHAGDYDKGVFQRLAFAPFVGRGLLTSEGPQHARQRKLVAPAFQPRHITAYAAAMAAHGDRWQAARVDGEVIDMHRAMMGLALAVVSNVLLGADVSADSAAIGDAMDTGVRWFQQASTRLLTLPLVVPTPRNRRTRAALAVVKRTVRRIIAEHRAGDGAERGARDDLLTLLLAARDEAGKPMGNKQLLDEVLTIFLAGHETTALALTWAFYLLATHPEVEARLHAEVDAVLGDRVPGVADLARLPYTLQVLKETLRLYPPSSAILRVALRDTMLGPGYSIRKRTSVVLSQYALHRRADTFPEPERFDPERFTPERERALPRYAYLPFGAGPRVCIGSHFALLEGHLLLATIARGARFALREPEVEVRPELALTLRPSRPVMVRAVRR